MNLFCFDSIQIVGFRNPRILTLVDPMGAVDHNKGELHCLVDHIKGELPGSAGH